MTRTSTLPTTKHAKLVYLLDHWDDIFSPPMRNTGQGNGGMALLPLMSQHPSVVELVRCLHVLKQTEPRWHDHVKAYHCAEWSIQTRYSTRKRKGGKTEQVVHRDRVRRPPAWVKQGYVRAGEFRLVDLFRGPVFIPEELWDALTLSSAEIESKRRKRPSGGGPSPVFATTRIAIRSIRVPSESG